MFKKMCFLTALIFIIAAGVSYSAVVTEIEPNNAPEKANHFTIGDAIKGQINYGDGYDYFKTMLPQSGIATVNISGYPSDCSVQVIISGFHPKYPTSTVGFVRSDTGRPLTFSFSGQGNKTGYVSVKLFSHASGVCSGSDWCAVQCSQNGPYYLTPFHDKPSKNVPSSYDGKPLLSPIQYQFTVALQALPDQYEPNHEEGMSKEQMLQKGMIKTIPIGQEITAYLFNEYPMMMRGTKGSENSGGGENDTDTYHIYLNQPDTVKVTLSGFPQNANSRIMIADSSGSWDESKTGATYFERKITKSGNVFIEISKGRENRPLIYSTAPYKMLVTTGAAAVVTSQPYQPPVVTQPPVTTAVLTVNQTMAYAGEKITVTFSGISSPAQQDWISLYKTGMPNEKYGEWYYLKGQSSGTLTFTAPNEPGEYEFRLFLNWPSGGYKDAAKSSVIRVTAKGTPSDKPNIFYNPTYKGYRVDICLTWGSNCQEPAATKFCQEMGYAKAKSWEIAHDIGNVTPTYVMGDDKICNQSFCDGFKFIECEGKPQPQGTGNWISYIKSGQAFKVIFDIAPTKFNDEGWQGANDPMGTLKGGETYTVSYSQNTGWTVTGYNEGTRGIGTWTYKELSPDKYQLNLWGRGYTFNEKGEVFDFEYGLVGHLSYQHQLYQPPVVTQPPVAQQPYETQQPYQPTPYPETRHPSYPPQGNVPEFKGEDDFWKSMNIYERK